MLRWTGIRWPGAALRISRRVGAELLTIRRLYVVRVADRLGVTAAGAPEPARAGTARCGCSFGIASTGKRGTGRATSGSATIAAGGSTIDLTEAAPSVAYGNASATRPQTPNHSRWRRDPNRPKPDGWGAGRAAAPAYAG